MKKLSAVFFLAVISIVAVNILPAQARGRLNVLSFTDEIERLIDNYFKSAYPSAEINYIFHPVEQFEDKLDSVLFLDYDAPDVFVLESQFVRKYVESDTLLDLSDIYEANKEKLLAYPAKVGTYNGRVYAMSWQAHPGAMFYRRSLARKYLGTDDPQAVQNYFSSLNKMMETAKRLADNSGGKCVLTASRRDIFYPFLYARKFPWTMKIARGWLVLDPVMERYMDVCKTLYDNGWEGRVVQWSEGWFAGMKGELVYGPKEFEVFSYFLPTWGLQYVLKLTAPETSGDWAMIPGPVPYRWGGSWLAAYKNTENPDLAKEFIRYLTADHSFLERYAIDTGDLVTSIPAIEKIQNNFREQFLGGQNHYAVFSRIAGNVNDKLAQRTDEVIQDFFHDAVNSYVYGEKTKAQALDDFRGEVSAWFVEYGIGAKPRSYPPAFKSEP